jgi:aminoglycoside 6'-N-acetyltransferase
VETRSLWLRHFVPEDAATALALSREETAVAWLPSQVYRDQVHALSALQSLIGCYSTPGDPRLGPYVLAIEERVGGAVIGHVGFSPLEGEVEIGFSIAMAFQRRGLASEVIVAASRWALREFALERIVGIASTANIASRRALERAGFAHEGDCVMRFQGTEQATSRYALSGGAGAAGGAKR